MTTGGLKWNSNNSDFLATINKSLTCYKTVQDEWSKHDWNVIKESVKADELLQLKSDHKQLIKCLICLLWIFC